MADIAAAESEETTKTKEATQDDSKAATDGGKPEAKSETEIPGVLPEETTDEDKDKDDDKLPDLTPDEDSEAYLSKHPEAKRVFDAYVARKEKGIQKWMQTKGQVADEDRTLAGFMKRLDDPETVDEAFSQLLQGLERSYGRKFGSQETKPEGEKPTPKTTDGKTEAELWDEQTADEIKERWQAENDARVDAKLDAAIARIERLLNPLAEDKKTQAETQALSKKADDSLNEIKKAHETTADQWVTKEMVIEALKQFPNLPPMKAFRAHNVDIIARKVAEHASKIGKQPVKNLAANSSGRQGDLKPGSSMMEVYEEIMG